MTWVRWSVACLLLGLFAGCENVQRSMVFITGTQVGVSLAVKPESDAPIELMIGYKRAEVLFDPVMEDAVCCVDDHHDHECEDRDPVGDDDRADSGQNNYQIRDQPHSVLAKLLGDFKTTGRTGGGPEGTGGVMISQWFASGKAAEILAASGGAVALTDQPAVAREIGQALAPQAPPSVVGAVALAAYDALNQLAANGDAKAAGHVAAMRAAVGTLMTPNRANLVRHFSFNSPVLSELRSGTVPTAFDQLSGHYQRMSQSATALAQAVTFMDGGGQLQVDGFNNPPPPIPSAPVAASASVIGQVRTHSVVYGQTLEDFDKGLRSNPPVLAGIRYLNEVTTGGTK